MSSEEVTMQVEFEQQRIRVFFFATFIWAKQNQSIEWRQRKEISG